VSSAKRVLHVVGRMDRAGVETWLMHALRLADRRRVQMDFLVHTDQASAYDEEILDRGSKILRSTAARRSVAYTRTVQSYLRGYDVVHSHVHHFSGYLLWLARAERVTGRIAHSHSDTSAKDIGAGWMRRAYLRLTKHLIYENATSMVGASRLAGRALFGTSWDCDVRNRVLHCGIDLAPFRQTQGRTEMRESLGIAPHELVIGHTGRFGPPKNHAFLVEVVAEVARERPDVRLLLVGDGPDRAAMEERSRALGIASRTIFAGIRGDVPALLQAMDVFLFPSLWEGLPLTVLEAQAAGLPCVISDVISDETDVVPGLTKRLPLAAGVVSWAREVLESKRSPNGGALSIVENSSFNISHSVKELYELYCA
jgi:glycosyltransferase involved in cell wall biosynthesis